MDKVTKMESAFNAATRNQLGLIGECLLKAAEEAIQKADAPNEIEWLYPQYGKSTELDKVA